MKLTKIELVQLNERLAAENNSLRHEVESLRTQLAARGDPPAAGIKYGCFKEAMAALMEAKASGKRAVLRGYTLFAW